MDRKYWIDRKRAAMALARDASTSESRMFHYELDGRCSIKAAYAANPDAGSVGRELYLPSPAATDPQPERRPRSNDNEPGDA